MSTSGKRDLILASGSPRRLELLRQIGVVPDGICPADIDERPFPRELPRAYVMRVARMKALAVADGSGWILAADTAVAVGRRILGKPSDRGEAGSFLRLLSGRRHAVLTAVALAAPDGEDVRLRVVASKVRFMRLNGKMIDDYLARDEWRDKAGGYAIQGRAAAWIDWMSGSYSGIVGLPLAETSRLLRAADLMPPAER